MKPETRKKYEGQLNAAKEAMQQLLPLAQRVNAVESEWKPLWEKIEKAYEVLDWKVMDSTQAGNTINPVIRSVNRMIMMFTGAPADQTRVSEESKKEEEILLNVPPGSTADRAIKLVLSSEQSLMGAVNLITYLYPMTDKLPIIQEIRTIATRIRGLPLEIAKTEGLK